MTRSISADTLLQRIESSRVVGRETTRDLFASSAKEAERSAERALDRRLEDLVQQRVVGALEAALSVVRVATRALGDPNDTAGKPQLVAENQTVERAIQEASSALDIALQESLKPTGVEAALEEQLTQIAEELLDRLNQQRARG